MVWRGPKMPFACYPALHTVFGAQWTSDIQTCRTNKGSAKMKTRLVDILQGLFTFRFIRRLSLHLSFAQALPLLHRSNSRRLLLEVDRKRKTWHESLIRIHLFCDGFRFDDVELLLIVDDREVTSRRYFKQSLMIFETVQIWSMHLILLQNWACSICRLGSISLICVQE